MEVENNILDIVVAQAALERRHNAASSGQYGRANQVIGGRPSAGKELAIENAVQIGRHFSQVEPSPAVAAAAVHFEQTISTCDGLRPAAFRMETTG